MEKVDVLTVILEKDCRENVAEIVQAIKSLRGVGEVTTSSVPTLAKAVALIELRKNLANQLTAVIEQMYSVNYTDL